MIRIRTLRWFLARPRYWPHFFHLVHWRLRNLRGSHNTAEARALALAWCERHAVDRETAFGRAVGAVGVAPLETTHKELLDAAQRIVRESATALGGAGDIDLIYQACERLGATRVVETGVGFGWSSLAFLLSLRRRPGARLVSTDLARPGGNSERYVGCVVPEDLRDSWTLIPLPDRQALPKALRLLPQIDLCHYDSDKSYEGRMWTYPRLWDALRSGGLFISDDVGDNFAFRDFCARVGQDPVVFEHGGKFIGILKRP